MGKLSNGNVPKLAVKIMDFPNVRALIIYYSQNVPALALPWCAAQSPAPCGWVYGKEFRGGWELEKSTNQRDSGTMVQSNPVFLGKGS